MTLAPLRVRHDPSLKKVRTTNKDLNFPSRTKCLFEKGKIGSGPTRKSNTALKGVQDSSNVSGATPAGVARVTPHGDSTVKRASTQPQVLKQRLEGYCQGYR